MQSNCPQHKLNTESVHIPGRKGEREDGRKAGKGREGGREGKRGGGRNRGRKRGREGENLLYNFSQFLGVLLDDVLLLQEETRSQRILP